MDLPDCPPGAEGYEDTVVEVAKKPDDTNCTKAEREFQDHLASLKIHVEDGSTRCMVERRGRDISGKWIYLCFPCAAVCSGESVLQTHISGKKHKNKLGLKDPWPLSIFEQHPYVLGEKGEVSNKTGATGAVLKKMAEEVDLHNTKPSELNVKYNRYRQATCHIQEILDDVKTPLLGLEYLIENPPEEEHHEPTYMCTLCTKQGHPRTIINHLTCFWHRYNYVVRHFPKAHSILAPYRTQQRCREGVSLVMGRLAQRIEDKYGRLRPVNIDKEVYDKEKDLIHQWLYKSYHFTEKPGATFEEVVDIDLIVSLSDPSQTNSRNVKRDPSPPVVAAPTRPRVTERARRPSPDSLSDISLEETPSSDYRRGSHSNRRQYGTHPLQRYDPRPDQRSVRPPGGRTNWRALKDGEKSERELEKERQKHEYKMKLAMEMRDKIELSAKKMLAYHEKNPEKHPLYPEEWKKFWNRRYKEIQAEGKDASKHDFKPEWIVFWTARMKELHDEEVKVHVGELYRKMCLTPPDMTRREDDRRKSPSRRKSPEPRWSPKRRSPGRRRSPEPRRRSPVPRSRSPVPRSRSPVPRSRSPVPRSRSPVLRRRSPIPRRRSPEPRRSPESRRRSPEPRRRSPEPRRRSPESLLHSVDYRRERRSPPPRPELPRPMRTRSRSPVRPAPRRSPARTHITLESARRSRSPLSARAAAPLRNRSPAPAPQPQPALAPSMQTVMVSDDELKPDDGLSPWNSDKSLDSLGSLPEARSPPRSRSRTASEVSRSSRRPQYSRASDPQDLGPPENVVATLRLLVALEDYLGSIGPKIVDLLTEALRMEKEKANSSEDLLVRDSAVVLIETAKEKLKGAVQAGLVAGGAASAVRAAVVRAAATLHAADTRAKQEKKEQSKKPTTSAVPVAGVGEVDRAQIAQQMAAALIAQGKTDVSSEELAQLVDAVVGMAEAKKREAAEKKVVEQRVPERPPPPRPAPAAAGTASALQMLQSAYDENDRKIENDAPTDAMDGLSDSDLETLLKNFNELSAEEQHSLIAYLKKLEARSPQRVERLRQYVSAAAAAGPAAVPDDAEPDQTADPAPEEEPPDPCLAPVTIESDDDDYTVEEVFKSATEKVKENQIRQEMEIVKKSLEETKTPPVLEDVENPPKEEIPTVDLTNFSSASDLLALVQASIQSTAKVAPAVSQASDVVTSNTQLRSFGDRSESSINKPVRDSRPLLTIPIQKKSPQATGNQQSNLLRLPPSFQNRSNDSYNNEPWNQAQSNRPQESFMQDNRGPMQDNRGPIQDNRGPMQDNRGPMQDNRGPMQDNRGPMQDNRGPMQDNRGPMQDNRGPMQDNRGPMQDNRGPMQDNRGPMQDNRGPMQDNRGPMQDNRGPMQDNRGPMQDNRGPMQDNRGPMQDNRGPMQDNRGPIQNNRGPMQDNRGPMHDNRGPMQDNRGPPMQNNRGPPMQDNRGPMQGMGGPPMQDNRGPMQDNRGPMQSMGGPPMQDNRGPMQGMGGPPMQDNRGPMQDNRGPMQGMGGPPMQENRGMMQDNRGPFMQGMRTSMPNRPPLIPGTPMRPQGFDNYGPPGPYNQGPRGNFMNGRMQDSYDMNQHQNNFRGRGRGNFGGPMRGRGRGFY